jgi:ribonuclease-3
LNHPSLHSFPVAAFEVPADQDGIAVNNERLETLGDAILQASITVRIFERFPRLTPGSATVMRASVLRNTHLVDISMAYGLPSQLRVGRYGNIQAHGKAGANVFEAYVGAAYRQYGWQVTHNWLCDVFANDLSTLHAHLAAAGLRDQNIPQAAAMQRGDYVTLLHLWVDRDRARRTVAWRLVAQTGPEHKPKLEMACVIDGETRGKGFGLSAQEARNACVSSNGVSRADVQQGRSRSGSVAWVAGLITR